jgi:hypothetical protein
MNSLSMKGTRLHESSQRFMSIYTTLTTKGDELKPLDEAH